MRGWLILKKSVQTENSALWPKKSRCSVLSNVIQLRKQRFVQIFDKKMRPDLAVKKLLKLKIDGSHVATVQDFLSNREQCVKFGNTKSIFSSSINIGVPQGTVLGPLLWNAFINDLSPRTPHLKYADDTNLYRSQSKPNCVLTNCTAHRAFVSINDNNFRRALNYTSQYCTVCCWMLTKLSP